MTAPAPSAAGARTVSVVVCAYTMERWFDLVAALESVAAQTVPALECLLVIDHNDELARRAREARLPCHVIESRGEKGLSGARNTGIEAASGEVVAFLDDDAVAAPDWIERLLAAYAAGPEVVAVGGRVVPAWVEARPSWFPTEFDWVIGCSHAGMPARLAAVRNMIGANMSLRRDVLVELGGFSTSLGRNGANGAGCEETELCIRAGAARPGAVVLYEPAAEVRHRVPAGRGTWQYYLRRCFGEGRSKALVSELAGSGAGLSSERSYVAATLPRGVARAAWAAARGNVAALGRAAAITAGLASTVAGYATASSGPVAHARRRLPALAGPAIALALWVSVLTGGVPLSRMTDLGLVSVLPLRFWIGLALLCVSFVALVRRRPRSPLLLGAHVAVLLAMLHGTPAVLYDTLRYQWAWKHVAVTDFVIAHHGVVLDQHNANLVAYQDWPGFFTLNALLTGASGLATPLSYASWAPLANEVLYGFPLMLIFRQLTTDERVRWSALFIFYLGNWIGQDYFSPQGFAFFLYLCVIAVVLRCYLRPAGGGRFGFGERASRRRARRGQGAGVAAPAVPGVAAPAVPGVLATPAGLAVPTGPGTAMALAMAGPGLSSAPALAGGRSRPALAPAAAGAGGSPAISARPLAPDLAAAGAVVVLLMVAIAVSHQLTPFMLVASLVLLTLCRRLARRWLAAASLLIAVAWMVTGAWTFVRLNLPVFYQGIGHILSNATVAKYNAGLASHDQLLIGEVDRLYTAFVVVLAMVGVWRCWRSGCWRAMLPALALLAAPGLAMGLNNYGGELLFRVYLFALPMLAFFAATVFERRRDLAATLADPGLGTRVEWRAAGRPGERAATTGAPGAAAGSLLQLPDPAARLRVSPGAARARARWQPPALRGVALGAAVLALLAGFAVSYYGKERSNYFSPAEVQAIESFYAKVPADSLVISAAGNLPWPLHHESSYESYLFTTDRMAAVHAIERHPVIQLSRDLSGPRPSYLVFATSDAVEVEMSGAMPPGDYQRIEAAVLASRRFRVVERNADVAIVTLARRAPRAARAAR